MSLIFATQLSAVATVALAVLALATAILAGLALRKQSREVAILVEENTRQAAERRRTQAARVFIGVPYDPPRLVSPYARNASDFPVFGAQFWYSGAQELAGPDELGVILPGKDSSAQRTLPHQGPQARPWLRSTCGRKIPAAAAGPGSCSSSFSTAESLWAVPASRPDLSQGLSNNATGRSVVARSLQRSCGHSGRPG